NPETGEHFEKLFGPGDHFGERVLLKSALRTGLVVALEDSVILWISQKDFIRFARAFPFLESYFKDYIDRTFGGTEKAFAPGSANRQAELETLP
ncbi:MAG: cyclic nucleotide-binding domain-containing protein, partial [Methyloceanibacter sp.]|nr:cyclic nucleotide-binding domain-containing protein [Methyloceanibacter sp.]